MIRCAYLVEPKIPKKRKPIFTVLWNPRVKNTQFLGHFNNNPFINVKNVMIFKCEVISNRIGGNSLYLYNGSDWMLY